MPLNPNILLGLQPADTSAGLQSFQNSLLNMQRSREIAADRKLKDEQADQQALMAPLQQESLEQSVGHGRRKITAQDGFEVYSAAKSLREIEDEDQRAAVMGLMAPELINRFGFTEQNLADGLDNGELDAVMSSTQQFATLGKGKSGLSSAKTEIYPDGTVVQSLPNNTSQVLNPEGNIVTGPERMKTLEAALQSKIDLAGGTATAAAQGKANVELDTSGDIAASIIESERPGRVETEKALGTIKTDVARHKALKGSDIGRTQALIKAKEFLTEFENGARSGAGRQAAGFIPGVYSSQGQFDEQFNAFAEVAARQKLKASGEIRPTDADVKGMKQAMFGVGRDEEVNKALLGEFIRELEAENAELETLSGTLKNKPKKSKKIKVDF